LAVKGPSGTNSTLTPDGFGRQPTKTIVPRSPTTVGRGADDGDAPLVGVIVGVRGMSGVLVPAGGLVGGGLAVGSTTAVEVPAG
jgi:hypothetical protein